MEGWWQRSVAPAPTTEFGAEKGRDGTASEVRTNFDLGASADSDFTVGDEVFFDRFEAVLATMTPGAFPFVR